MSFWRVIYVILRMILALGATLLQNQNKIGSWHLCCKNALLLTNCVHLLAFGVCGILFVFPDDMALPLGDEIGTKNC